MSTSFRCIVACLLCTGAVHAQTPTITDDRLVIELVAREPDIVTPTGLTVDEQGRVWVLENHTHQRPANYKGPASDRIRVFSDFDETGKARKVTTFAEGFKNSMGIALGKLDEVYLATRSEIIRMYDRDGTAKDKRTLIRLETKGNYPHNGLCGFAFDPLGRMVFGMGENLGEPYKLIGADGVTLEGGGEGGNLFCCNADGTKLTRIATGFWNPFHHCFDAFGRLFVVDNDPDARGPCRLLHVVPGGDYGYRFRYGRKGTHPFQAWNGELPGTLGMVAGTGEAPSGIVAYESTGLPAEYRGQLFVTSWGDHVVELFQLFPRGVSFGARSKTLVRGGENFRPVAVAVGPDGAVYLSDWVDKSYPVHGKGRIWRIRAKKPPPDDGLRPGKVPDLDADQLRKLLGHPKQEIRTAASEALLWHDLGSRRLLTAALGEKDTRTQLHALWAFALLGKNGARSVASALNSGAPEVRAEAVRLYRSSEPEDEDRVLRRARKDPSALVRMQAVLRSNRLDLWEDAVPFLADPDPFLMSAAIHVLGQAGKSERLLAHIRAADPRMRLGVLLALRRIGDTQGRAALGKFLEDPDPEVRRTAIQWVGEERLKEWAPRLNAAATAAPTNRELFRALLAANHLLGGGKPDADPADEKLLVRVLQEPAQPGIFRLLALQTLRPDHPALSAGNLADILAGKDSALRREAVRSLALRGDHGAQEYLLKLASDQKAEADLRADALLGVAPRAGSEEVQHLLLSLLEQPSLRRDALRSLRGTALEADTEKALLTWWDQTKLPEHERPELAAQLLLALQPSKAAEVEKYRRSLEEAAGPRPKDEAAWRQFLSGRGDPVAGERVFFHAQGPRCASCHRIDGRGGRIGPELSTIGRTLSRERLIESILTPSKEIAPMFVSWTITTSDGKSHVGVVVDEGPHSTVTLANAEGKLTTIKRQDIEERVALPTSIMPDKLHEQMTPREFLDLIAYLSERK